MMKERVDIRRALVVLLILSVLVRAFVAWFVDLGFDEVYYWTYAKFPDLSHFDHPPMVGWVIRLFSLDLLLRDPFFLRLGAVVCGTLNTWLIYQAGKAIKSPLTGLYAAFLYTGSFYAFVLCGIFILPDSPQSVFWLATILFLARSLPDRSLMRNSRLMLLAAGFTAGLAMLSKYHAVALPAGAFFYVLFYNRRWFRARETWLAFLIAILVFMPVLIWNYRNGWISFSFHESRIIPGQKLFRPEFFATELLGQFFYNNPVNVIIILSALGSAVLGRSFLEGKFLRLLLWVSLPLVVVVLLFSLFRQTLPHWSGPAWFGLMLAGAAWLEERGSRRRHRKLMPGAILASLLLMISVLGLAAAQIRYGVIRIPTGKVRDVSLDLYGWDQLGRKVAPVIAHDEACRIMPPDAPILTFRWFPAANFDYYLGRRTGNPVYAVGDLKSIHKYHWIDHLRGDLPAGTCAYYIALSDDFQPASALYGALFDTILPPDTVPITREGKVVREVYIYRMKGLRKRMTFPLSLK